MNESEQNEAKGFNVIFNKAFFPKIDAHLNKI